MNNAAKAPKMQRCEKLHTPQNADLSLRVKRLTYPAAEPNARISVKKYLAAPEIVN
jgi:hypothetical protein